MKKVELELNEEELDGLNQALFEVAHQLRYDAEHTNRGMGDHRRIHLFRKAEVLDTVARKLGFQREEVQ